MSTPQNIILIRFSSIGDVLLTTPIVRVLKKNYPDAALHYVTKDVHVCLVENNPCVDNIFSLPSPYSLSSLLSLREEVIKLNPDMVVDLHSNMRSLVFRILLSGTHMIYKKKTIQRFKSVLPGKQEVECDFVAERYFSAIKDLGMEPDGKGLDFFPGETREDLDVIESAGVDLQSAKRVTLCPGAGRKTKQWPEEYFAALTELLVDEGFSVVLAGSADEQELCTRVSGASERNAAVVAGKLTLRQTGILLSHSAAAVCNDSGLMHLSTAVDTPVAAIFGSTARELGFFPYQARAEVLESDLPCRPCTRHGKKACPRGHFKCMKHITPVMVLEAVKRLVATP